MGQRRRPWQWRALGLAATWHLLGQCRGELPFTGFIRAWNGNFVDDSCRAFPVMGFNTWDLMESAAGYVPRPPALLAAHQNAVQYTMQAAAANGLTVVRAFGHGTQIWHSIVLQTAPGVYDETAFKALDYILATAAKSNVRIIFTMADEWKEWDSKAKYVQWANETDPDAFWTAQGCRDLYKAHMRAMTSRVNTFTGVAYKDDPTIFAWNLMNEPRCNCFPPVMPPESQWNTLPASCRVDCADTITAWVNEMAPYLKSLDPAHLVTVGEEGFWAAQAPYALRYNPGNYGDPPQLGWAALTGQNFTAQHASPAIDFCTAHYYPDLWNTDGFPGFTDAWIDSHAVACARMGKPFVLEEFGRHVDPPVTAANISAQRDPLFRQVYTHYNTSLAQGTNFQGALFWKWNAAPGPADPNDTLAVSADDDTFRDIVVPTARAALLSAAQRSPLPGCVPVRPASGAGAAPAAPAPPSAPPPPTPGGPGPTVPPGTVPTTAEPEPAALPLLPRLPTLPNPQGWGAMQQPWPGGASTQPGLQQPGIATGPPPALQGPGQGGAAGDGQQGASPGGAATQAQDSAPVAPGGGQSTSGGPEASADAASFEDGPGPGPGRRGGPGRGPRPLAGPGGGPPGGDGGPPAPPPFGTFLSAVGSFFNLG